MGQLFHLTAVQRRSLLVAGAVGGYERGVRHADRATLFGVELLAFEFKPRSMTLIALAAATADGLRMVMANAGLVRPAAVPDPAAAQLGGVALLGAAAIGVVVGLSAWVMTQAVYGAEDAFKKLTGHLHWMWWPTIGGLIIGLGGLVDSRALGVGYGTIHAELLGQLGIGALAALCVVKLAIWSCGLGGGTSGGILAPILMMGAALGGILGHALPGGAPSGVWALLGLAAALGGVTRSPFTAIIFAFELTHDQNSLLALLIAATVAHLVSVLVLKRSILTEKVARRGFHVMREYAVDPLEATFVREIMETDIFSVDPDRSLGDLYDFLQEGSSQRRQRLYPVLEADGRLVGVLPWSAVLEAKDEAITAREAMVLDMAVAHPDEILRPVADRMAAREIGVLPVVARGDPSQLDGLVTQFDLLRARQKLLVEERHAERLLRGGGATRNGVQSGLLESGE